MVTLLHNRIFIDPNIFYKAFQGNSFVDLDGWTAVNADSTELITACSGIRMVGGFGVFGKLASAVK